MTSSPCKLAGIDRRMLDILQRDGDRAASGVAGQVGLSTTPCWRRIRGLEENEQSGGAARSSTGGN